MVLILIMAVGFLVATAGAMTIMFGPKVKLLWDGADVDDNFGIVVPSSEEAGVSVSNNLLARLRSKISDHLPPRFPSRVLEPQSISPRNQSSCQDNEKLVSTGGRSSPVHAHSPSSTAEHKCNSGGRIISVDSMPRIEEVDDSDDNDAKADGSTTSASPIE